MLLSEPPESPYDLNFQLFGFPIRVTWSFWVAGLVLGYNGAMLVDRLFIDVSSGVFPWLILWCGIMFLSILLHELGHAVAFRLCGIQSSVVLYHFGGLAIPRGGFVPGRGGRFGSNERIFVAAMGPAVQLVLALGMVLVTRAAGYNISDFLPRFLAGFAWIQGGAPVRDASLFAVLFFGLFVNVWWPLLNLLPVWPLDGGQIARELVIKAGGTLYNASLIGVIAAGLIAFWMFTSQRFFGGILFISLAATNYQLMNTTGQWR